MPSRSPWSGTGGTWFTLLGAILLALALAGCASASPSPAPPNALAPSGSATPKGIEATPSLADVPATSPAESLVPPSPVWVTTPRETPAPSPTSTPERTPTAEPSTEPTAPPPLAYRPAPIAVDGFVEVLAEGLRVRTEPRPAATILDVHPEVGGRLFVVAGPTQSAGYTWYQVAPSGWERGSAWGRNSAWQPTTLIGWVAASSSGGEPWVAGREPVCPGAPDLARIVAMSPLERVVCLGASTLTLTSGLDQWNDDFGPNMPWGSPEWLNGVRSAGVSICGLGDLAFAESIVGEAPWARVSDFGDEFRLTGHFDDPASASCRGGWTGDESHEPPEPPSEEPVVEQVLGCRVQFVVTKIVALHRIVAGETLSGIATAHGIALGDLLAANPEITNPRLIPSGAIIRVPLNGN